MEATAEHALRVAHLQAQHHSTEGILFYCNNEQKRRYLEALKKQIDSSAASSLQDQLDQATVTVKTQEFDPEWCDDIIAGRIVTADVYSMDINKSVENVGDLEVPLLNKQKQGDETKQATILPIGPPPPSSPPPRRRIGRRPWYGCCSCCGDYEAPPPPRRRNRYFIPWYGCCSCCGEFEYTITKACERSLLLFSICTVAWIVANLIVEHNVWPFQMKTNSNGTSSIGFRETLICIPFRENDICWEQQTSNVTIHCNTLDDNDLQLACSNWGIITAIVVMCILWISNEIAIKTFDLEWKDKIDSGKHHQSQLDKNAIKTQMLPESRRKSIYHSLPWDRAVNRWKARKKLRRSLGYQRRSTRAKCIYFLFVILFIGVYVLVLNSTFMPRKMLHSDNTVLNTVTSVIFGQRSGMGTMLLLSFMIMEFTIHFLAVSVTLWWDLNTPPIYKRNDCETEMEMYHRKEFKEANETTSLDEFGGAMPSTCLLIACHMSTLTKERESTFTGTLRSALKVFDPQQIFVIDNGPSQHPVDRTEEICTKISLDHDPSGHSSVHYLYIPEGNKTHAMWWTSERWIPHLVRLGHCNDFKFAMIVDDDVPISPELCIPFKKFESNNNIKALSIPFLPCTEDGRPNKLVELQGFEYELFSTIPSKIQYSLAGTTIGMSQAYTFYRRDILGPILQCHSTVFHGEQDELHDLLRRMNPNFLHVIDDSQEFPVFTPERLLILWRQRVTSWTLSEQRRVCSRVGRELFCTCRLTSCLAKPFLLLQMLRVLQSWCILPLVICGIYYDWVQLLVLFSLFVVLESIVFSLLAYKRYREWILGYIFCQCMLPKWILYRLFLLLLVGPASFLRNWLLYFTWRKKNRNIIDRLTTLDDTPPLPPIANPDWHTIFHTSTDESNFRENHKKHLQTSAGIVKQCVPNITFLHVNNIEIIHLSHSISMIKMLMKNNAVINLFPRVRQFMIENIEGVQVTAPNRLTGTGALNIKIIELPDLLHTSIRYLYQFLEARLDSVVGQTKGDMIMQKISSYVSALSVEEISIGQVGLYPKPMSADENYETESSTIKSSETKSSETKSDSLVYDDSFETISSLFDGIKSVIQIIQELITPIPSDYNKDPLSSIKSGIREIETLIGIAIGVPTSIAARAKSLQQQLEINMQSSLSTTTNETYTETKQSSRILDEVDILNGMNYDLAVWRDQNHPPTRDIGEAQIFKKLGTLVVLGRQRFDNTLAAIKIINLDIQKQLHGPNAEKNALDEMQILSKLDHPHIVKYYPGAQDGRFLCIPMGVCSSTLYEQIGRGGSVIPPECVLKYALQISLGLKYLHYEKKLVHRDLKLDNIMIRDDTGNICLTDLGLSRRANEHGQNLEGLDTMNTSMMATLAQQRGHVWYRSPENVDNNSITFQDDMWALGLILLELLHSQQISKLLNFKKANLFIDSACHEKYCHLLNELINQTEDSSGSTKQQPQLGSEVKLKLSNIIRRLLVRNPKERLTSVEMVREIKNDESTERRFQSGDATMKWHIFLSHAQATGGDQTHNLCLYLMQRGLRCWYDNKATDVTSKGMKEGVALSEVFLLFLSKDVLTRPFVQFELSEALRLHKKILFVHEIDDKHHKFDFGEFDSATLCDLSQVEPGQLGLMLQRTQLLTLRSDVESTPWNRKEPWLQASIDTIVQMFDKCFN